MLSAEIVIARSHRASLVRRNRILVKAPASSDGRVIGFVRGSDEIAIPDVRQNAGYPRQLAAIAIEIEPKFNCIRPQDCHASDMLTAYERMLSPTFWGQGLARSFSQVTGEAALPFPSARGPGPDRSNSSILVHGVRLRIDGIIMARIPGLSPGGRGDPGASPPKAARWVAHSVEHFLKLSP